MGLDPGCTTTPQNMAQARQARRRARNYGLGLGTVVVGRCWGLLLSYEGGGNRRRRGAGVVLRARAAAPCGLRVNARCPTLLSYARVACQ